MERFREELINKPYGAVKSAYLALGLDPDNVLYDMVRYCFPMSNIGAVTIPENIPIHPCVTPEIMASFLYATLRDYPRLCIRLITECSKYDRYDEVALILTAPGTNIRIHRLAPADAPLLLLGNFIHGFSVDFDRFIFISDIFVNNGFRNSLKYNICIDNFGMFDDEIADYKELCTNMLKACY